VPIKLGIVTTGVALLLGGTAQAAEQTPPICPSAVQVGSTGVVERGTTTTATITQFEGCGAKSGHIHVQSSSKALNDKCTIAVGTVDIGEIALPGSSGSSCRPGVRRWGPPAAWRRRTPAR
jgi:hypothetical protein